MRKLLNTLYVTQPNAYLACDGENVLVRIDQEVKFRMPVHNLEGIVCFGFAGASPGLMSLCCERGVALSFLTEYGKYLGAVHGPVTGNVLLRKTQYRYSEDLSMKLRLSRRFVEAKIMNSRAVLHRAIRDHADNVAVDKHVEVMKRMQDLVTRIEAANDTDEVRGYEGEAAARYFSCFDGMILANKSSFSMQDRNRRPPTDRVNALLSFLYTLLMHEARAALESVGLDPQVGYLHEDRPGRPSLALDLMEELRPHFVDRLTLSLINRQQIIPEGFVVKENGAVLMDEATRKTVLTAWQQRKVEEITHPFLDEKIPFGLVPYVQALLLARYIRGDLEDYPPFFWK